MTRDWWDTPPTKIHIRFNADQIHAELDPGGNPRIQIDPGQTQVTLHPADAATLTELHNLIGILLDQLDPTRKEHAAADDPRNRHDYRTIMAHYEVTEPGSVQDPPDLGEVAP